MAFEPHVGTYPKGPPPVDAVAPSWWPQERQVSRRIATQRPVQFIEGILSVHQTHPTRVNYTIENQLVVKARGIPVSTSGGAIASGVIARRW
jgi:hypothetical protein